MKYYRICRVKCRWCGDLLEHINQAKADSHFRIRWYRCGKVGLDPAAVGYRIMGEPAAYEDLSEECDGKGVEIWYISPAIVTPIFVSSAANDSKHRKR